MAELLIAANLLMLACLAECVFGRSLLLRAICGGLSSVFSGLSAGMLVHLYSLSGGPDAGRSFLQLYLPVAAYALIFICGAFLLIARRCARRSDISEKKRDRPGGVSTGPVCLQDYAYEAAAALVHYALHGAAQFVLHAGRHALDLGLQPLLRDVVERLAEDV